MSGAPALQLGRAPSLTALRGLGTTCARSSTAWASMTRRLWHCQVRLSGSMTYLVNGVEHLLVRLAGSPLGCRHGSEVWLQTAMLLAGVV